MNLTFAVWRVNVNLNLSNNPVHLILLIDSFILLLSILKVNNSSFMANLVPRVLSYPFLRSERARVGERPWEQPVYYRDFRETGPWTSVRHRGKTGSFEISSYKCPS